MKTEAWPMDFVFDRAPRWNPDVGPRPVLVYLDQWCWNLLVHDRAGESAGQPEEGIYGYLKDLAASGRVVFPLSQAHYRENWARQNEDARWDTAVVMAELSGFNAITAVGLDAWEARVAVASHFGIETDVRPPEPFGWGMNHCIRGVTSAACVVDVRTGKRAVWEGLPIESQMVLAELEDEAAYRFELAMLGRRDPRLEDAAALEPFPPVPNEDGPKFDAMERELADRIQSHGKSEPLVRNSIELLSFRDSQSLLREASVSLGLAELAVVEDIADRVDNGDKSAVRGFLGGMPILRTFIELRVRAHCKDSFNFRPSDLFDFWAMATVTPFVDVAVADRRTFNLMIEAEEDRRQPVRLVRKLSELRATLEEAVA